MLTLPEPPLPEGNDLDFWSLWLMATNLARGEDIDLCSSPLMLPSEASGTLIGYCEITLTGEGPVGGRLHNPNAELLHRGDRIDLFVNRMQAEKAYQDLESLSGDEVGQAVTLFGRLTIKVVKTRTS